MKASEAPHRDLDVGFAERSHGQRARRSSSRVRGTAGFALGARRGPGAWGAAAGLCRARARHSQYEIKHRARGTVTRMAARQRKGRAIRFRAYARERRTRTLQRQVTTERVDPWGFPVRVDAHTYGAGLLTEARRPVAVVRSLMCRRALDGR